MALTATASQGFELYDYLEPNQVLWVPGDPGDTLTRGDRVVATVGEGVVDLAAANEGGLVGRVEKTTVCPSLATAFPNPNTFDPANSGLTLVPISLGIAAKIPRYRVTFKNHVDDTVITYVAATPSIAATAGNGADDRPNGALLYVYEGPGIGEVNVVADYDHTGHTDGELAVITHRAFAATLTSASKYICLSGEAAADRGIGFFNRAEGADEDELTTNQGADDGDYVVVMSWEETARNLKNLMLLVIDARYLMLA